MIIEVVSGVISLFVLLYVWLSWKWTYWTKKGVFQFPPVFPFGDNRDMFLKKKSARQALAERKL